MNLPKLTIKNRRLLILSILLLGCLGPVVGVNETLVLTIGGFLTLLKSDGDKD